MITMLVLYLESRVLFEKLTWADWCTDVIRFLAFIFAFSVDLAIIIRLLRS